MHLPGLVLIRERLALLQIQPWPRMRNRYRQPRRRSKVEYSVLKTVEGIQIIAMGWKNVATIVPGRLFMGK